MVLSVVVLMVLVVSVVVSVVVCSWTGRTIPVRCLPRRPQCPHAPEHPPRVVTRGWGRVAPLQWMEVEVVEGVVAMACPAGQGRVVVVEALLLLLLHLPLCLQAPVRRLPLLLHRPPRRLTRRASLTQ